MAQTGYSLLQIYSSSTGGNTPAAGNLTNDAKGSELAINIADGKLFYKDSSNVVQVIGWKTTPATAGGTGQTSYAVGDLLYADTTTTLSKLADVATGNALISGGVSTAPSWGKIGLTTHVTGILPTANGGTNLASFTSNGILYASSTSALTTSGAFTFTSGTTVTIAPTVTTTGGDFRVTNTSGNFYHILDNSTGTFSGTAYAAAVWHSGNYPLTFGTNNTERMRIHASGGLSLGNITDPGAANFSVSGITTTGVVYRQGTYTAGTTTPSVTGISLLYIANTGATSITNFTGGVQGQIITLIFADANTTITRNNAYLSGGVNFVSTASDTLTLINYNNLWYEVSRGINA